MEVTKEELAIINGLNKSESFKEKLIKFRQATTGEYQFGFPKAEPGYKNRFEIISLWALIFGALPFFD